MFGMQKRYHDESQTVRIRAKTKLFGIIYSRTAIVLGLVLIQLGIMFVVFHFLDQYTGFLYYTLMALSGVVVIYIVNDKGSPAFKISWLLFVLLVPIAGTGFYVFTKTEVGTKHIGLRLEQLRNETEPYMKQNPHILNAMKGSRVANNGLSHYLYNRVGFPTYGNTRVVYFPLGDDKFPVLLEELRKAQKYIFLEYFIVQEGEMWNSVLEVLKAKVRQGVEVRFMYDGMCSIQQLPYDYPETIRKYGIKCKQFAPIKPVVSTAQNNRDHRKICVIDGMVAFTGGVNLADEYINRKVRFGHWKDTAIMLKGDAVQSFTMMFLQMWNVQEKEPEHFSKYVTKRHTVFEREYGFVIPYGDSPYDHENVGEEVYLHILNHSRKYVHIMTPYLILDNEMTSALIRAAKNGIEVKIIMPHIPDKPYAFSLAKTYYGELVENGVQIYEYIPGFVHAKVFVSDDDTATVGTVNLDYRSLFLHFECGAFIYRNPVVAQIENDFQNTLRKCKKITLLDVKNQSPLDAIYGRILRLVAPLM